MPLPGPEADRKALIERGAGDPLRVGEQRNGNGLFSRQMRRARLHGSAGPGVEKPQGFSRHSGNLKHAPGSAGEQHRDGGWASGQFGRE